MILSQARLLKGNEYSMASSVKGIWRKGLGSVLDRGQSLCNNQQQGRPYAQESDVDGSEEVSKFFQNFK